MYKEDPDNELSKNVPENTKEIYGENWSDFDQIDRICEIMKEKHPEFAFDFTNFKWQIPIALVQICGNFKGLHELINACFPAMIDRNKEVLKVALVDFEADDNQSFFNGRDSVKVEVNWLYLADFCGCFYKDMRTAVYDQSEQGPIPDNLYEWVEKRVNEFTVFLAHKGHAMNQEMADMLNSCINTSHKNGITVN